MISVETINLQRGTFEVEFEYDKKIGAYYLMYVRRAPDTLSEEEWEPWEFEIIEALEEIRISLLEEVKTDETL